MTDIDDLLHNSERAEVIEDVAEAVQDDGAKIAVIILRNKEEGRYNLKYVFWKVGSTVEAAGMLGVAWHDLLHDDKEVGK